MLIVPEREIAALMTRDAAFSAVEKVFAAMADAKAYNFPVVRAAIGHEDALYGFKGGFDMSAVAMGFLWLFCGLIMALSAVVVLQCVVNWFRFFSRRSGVLLVDFLERLVTLVDCVLLVTRVDSVLLVTLVEITVSALGLDLGEYGLVFI